MKPRLAQKRIAFIALIALTIGLITTQWGPSSSPNNLVNDSFTTSLERRFSPIGISTIGDFDGDRRLDQAELHLAGFHRYIQVRFGDSRESHLELGAGAQLIGALLSRDINRDNHPDLIWLSHCQSKSSVVWLGDGFGHFTKAPDTDDDSGLRALLFGDPDNELVGDNQDERFYLTPDPVAVELTRAANLGAAIHRVFLIAEGNGRRDLGLYLSYLRERGPPLHISFA